MTTAIIKMKPTFTIIDSELIMSNTQPTLQQRIAASDALLQAQQAGLDLNLLWDNLQRPISERMRRHQIALDSLRQLRNAYKSSTYLKSVWNQMGQ